MSNVNIIFGDYAPSQRKEDDPNFYDFIPMVEIDPNQLGPESSQNNEAGFSIHSLHCQDSIFLSKALDHYVYQLYAIVMEDKDVEVRFLVTQGAAKATDDFGIVRIEPHGVKLTNKTQVEVSYGEAFSFGISHENIKKNAFIDFMASDKDGFFGIEGKQNIHCGRLRVLQICKDKDVFSKNAINRLAVSPNRLNLVDNACITTADARISELLENTNDFYNKLKPSMSHGEYTPRLEYLKKLGFVFGEIKNFRYKKNRMNKPILEESIFNYIKNQTKNRIGFHVYYFSLLDDIHVLTLVVHTQGLCNQSYRVFDQGTGWSTSNFQDLQNMDHYFEENTKSLNAWYQKNYKIMAKNTTKISKITQK